MLPGSRTAPAASFALDFPCSAAWFVCRKYTPEKGGEAQYAVQENVFASGHLPHPCSREQKETPRLIHKPASQHCAKAGG